MIEPVEGAREATPATAVCVLIEALSKEGEVRDAILKALLENGRRLYNPAVLVKDGRPV